MNIKKDKDADLLHSSQKNYDEIKLAEFFYPIYERKKIVLISVLIGIIISIIFGWVSKKTYLSTASILPPISSSSSLTGDIVSATGQLGNFIDLLPSYKTGPELYLGILESRSVATIIIDKYNLKEYYNKKIIEEVLKELKKKTKIELENKSRIISISFEDHDPKLAAEITNSYIEALDIVLGRVTITSGQRKRKFLENRLLEIERDLSEWELKMKDFQEKYRVVSLEEQNKATIELVADIQNEIFQVDSKLKVLKNVGTENQIEAILLKTKLDVLKDQLESLEGRGTEELLPKGNSGENRIDSIIIPLKKMPELGIKYSRILRELKIQQSLFELVTTQYELAKIEEAKDIGTIQILDTAAVPEKKYRPQRFKIVVLGMIISLVFSIIIIGILEYIKKIQNFNA